VSGPDDLVAVDVADPPQFGDVEGAASGMPSWVGGRPSSPKKPSPPPGVINPNVRTGVSLDHEAGAARRAEDGERAGRRGVRVVPAADRQLALEDAAGLVLAVVDVVGGEKPGGTTVSVRPNPPWRTALAEHRPST
jgi:hypothetical protein